MTSRAIAIVVALLGVAGLGAAGWLMLGTSAPPPPPPEVAIRTLVGDCLKAANMRDMGGIIKHTAEDFVGPQNTGKQQLAMGMQALRNPELKVLFNPKLEIKVTSPTTATATGTLVFGRTKAPKVEALPPSSIAGIFALNADFELRDGQWLFTRADYQTAEHW